MNIRSLFRWESSFTQTVFRIAIPIVIQSLVTASMHIVDNVMVGQLGEAEIAAVTQANRISFLFQLILFGLGGGTSVFVAQYWGKGDMKGIRKVMGLALAVSFSVSLVFAAVVVLMPHKVMGIFLHEQVTIDLASQYLSIVGFCYIFQSISFIVGTVQKSTEQVKLPMAAGITAIVINTVFNYGLILGKLGMPKLGVQGAAIATVTATGVEMLLVVCLGYKFRFATAAKIRELLPGSRAFVKRFFRIALPVICNETLWAMGVLVYSIVYGHMGTTAVAAFSIFNTVDQLTLVLARGLVGACSVMVGKAIGMGEEDMAQLYAKRLYAASVVVAQLTGFLIMALSGLAVSLYNVSPEVARTAQTLICISAGCMWLMASNNIIVVGILRAGGDVKYSLVLDAGTVWVVGVPMAILGGIVLGLPIQYVYAMILLEGLVKMIIGFRRFLSKKWIHNVVRHEDDGEIFQVG